MRVYLKEDINEILNIKNKDYFASMDECDTISREVYDNEYLLLNFYVLGDSANEEINVNFSVDQLASNLNPNNLPSDVKIFTVFNRDIIRADGKSESLPINITNENLTPVYIGIDCSYLAHHSNIMISIGNENVKNIAVSLNKNSHMLRDKGADVPSSLARLSWLNSTLFLNNKKSYIYNDIEVDNNVLKFLGKDVILTNDGFIENIITHFTDNLLIKDGENHEILDGGMKFVVNDNVKFDSYNIERIGANIIIHAIGEGDNVKVYNNCKVKYTGVFEYDVEVVAKNDCVIDAEQINSFSKSATKYMNGLSHEGGYFKPFNYKWDSVIGDNIYIGDICGGANIKWMAENYVMPLPDENYRYREITMPSSTWDNDKSGGIDVLYEKERAKVCAYTGKIKLVAGEKRVFRYIISLTPFHELDIKKHFSERNYQINKINASPKSIVSKASKHGANNITLSYNAYTYTTINYPFMEMEKIKNFVNEAHENHILVKLYYNLKDISIRCPEITAFATLGDNIIFRSTNTINNNISSQVESKLGANPVIYNAMPFSKGPHQSETNISVQLSPQSRYNNYYVETVNHLVKEYDIRGIEIEDRCLDADTIERVRKVLDRYDSNIEMVVNPHLYSKNNKGSEMVNATPLLPYIDSILTGYKSNLKNMSPEKLLIEMSGIPYGVSGDLVECDPFLGLLFGMTNRAGINDNNNDKLYKLFSKFDIKNSEMVGFWSKDALHATDDGVKITYYKNKQKVLICMYNFNNAISVFNVDYSPLAIDGIMKSFPMSKLIINQKFTEKTQVVLYNKCGVFILADLK